MKISNSSALYGSLVWIFSALVIFFYVAYALLGHQAPGVEQLVTFLQSVEGWQIYLAAFISIFIEGLYLVGNLFPGSTLVILIAILSQVGGPFSFVTTIILIFLGWSLAGGVNIVLAKLFHWSVLKKENQELEVRDRMWTTWFPAFRANYEVAQVSEGANLYKVLFSSVRVKFCVSIVMAMVTLLIPLFIDINESSNEEGFFVLGVIGAITLVVGLIKLRNAIMKL